jgi:hypothetical protein
MSRFRCAARPRSPQTLRMSYSWSRASVNCASCANIARDLDRNVRNSWLIILGPNLACIGDVFTLGFGIGASVVTNNIAALAALANGLLPMRRVAELEAERRHVLEMELRQSGLLHEGGSQIHPEPETPADQQRARERIESPR